MADELIDILNDNGSPSGEVRLKSEAHFFGLWHASVQIWIITPKGDILVQKRASNKDTYPNLWDISVAGHLTFKDTPIIAALREIEEEIGLQLKKNELIFLKTIKKIKTPSPLVIDNEFNHLFICKLSFNLSDLSLQEEEVSDIKFISINNFEKDIIKNSNHYVPHGKEYYFFIINELKRLLNN